jgi:type II secretory ATPase GspE/PulE/Tfp pilus assembly ATPase PilB-like protein
MAAPTAAAPTGTKNQLLEIANLLNAAPGVREVLAILRERLPALVSAERVVVWGLDVKNQQLFSILRADRGGSSELRIPRNFGSIAGFCALAKQPINVRNVFDPAELKTINPKLSWDPALDEQFGSRTRQVFTVPIRYERFLLGVLEVANKTAGESFNREDESNLGEICRILGLVLYNQTQVAKQNQPNKFGNLISLGLVSEGQLGEATKLAQNEMREIGSILMEKFAIRKEDLVHSLSVFYNTGFFVWDGTTGVPDELKERVSSDFLLKNICVPIRREAGVVLFAIDDPFDLGKIDNIKVLGLSPRYDFWVGLPDDIRACIKASYGIEETAKGENMDDILADLEANASGEAEEVEGAAPEQDDIQETDSAIVRLANKIVCDAYEKGATDIHIEPRGALRPVQIRFRVDGDCVPGMEIPGSHRNALVSRFKIMSKLDIAEKRLPQDGKIRFKGPMGTIELRVATIPTTNGNEDIVMRILASSKPLPMENLGMSRRNFEETQKLMQKPYGMFLCVGPTGSGKTTTLHSCLGHINTPDMKIWTVEDPVEITQDGLRQVEINRAKKLDFARAMRAFLRADPDVIMVGEMRDGETAGAGIEASLTGHLVVSTLHTNSAPETISRLLDMGLDPFNFADALLGVLAQRLAKTLCGKCKEPYHPTDFEWEELRHLYGEEEFDQAGYKLTPETTLNRPKGCPACGNSGYKGRVGLHELLVTSDELKRLIAKKAAIETIRQQSIAEGMTTLLQDGIWKVLTGRTDAKNVKAVCIK